MLYLNYLCLSVVNTKKNRFRRGSQLASCLFGFLTNILALSPISFSLTPAVLQTRCRFSLTLKVVSYLEHAAAKTGGNAPARKKT